MWRMLIRNNMDVNYRVLGKGDSLQYRALRLDSLKLHPECFGAGYEAQCKLPKLYFEKLIESNSQESVMIGALVNNDLVGLCGLTPTKDGRSLEVIQMYVSSKYRGMSLAQKMLSYAKYHLENREENTLILTVYNDNNAAIKVYEKSGFKLTDKYENELVMVYQP